MIPIWGSGRDLIHAAQTGDKLGVALNAAFLVWDIASVAAGVLTFGTATAAMMAGKAGVRTAFKAAGKVVARGAEKKLAALVAKTALLKEGWAAARVAFAKIPRVCVTACFPAGTPVAGPDGFRNIEDIAVGDLVWAWNEETGDLALKPVTQTMRRESDALVELVVGADTVRATPEHPFRVNGAWKQAGELVVGDTLLRADGLSVPISQVTHHSEQATPVFNFEVADWHTYLVSWWMFVVHNTKVCLLDLAKAGVKYAEDILKGNRFNQIMEKRLADGVHELWLKGMKARLDTYIPNKKIISRKATQLAEISEETAKNYINELTKKFKAGKEVQNVERAGTKTLKGKYVLQVPKQEKAIPEAVKAYAKVKQVTIETVDDVTDAMLKWWEKPVK